MFYVTYVHWICVGVVTEIKYGTLYVNNLTTKVFKRHLEGTHTVFQQYTEDNTINQAQTETIKDVQSTPRCPTP